MTWIVLCKVTTGHSIWITADEESEAKDNTKEQIETEETAHWNIQPAKVKSCVCDPFVAYTEYWKSQKWRVLTLTNLELEATIEAEEKEDAVTAAKKLLYSRDPGARIEILDTRVNI